MFSFVVGVLARFIGVVSGWGFGGEAGLRGLSGGSRGTGPEWIFGVKNGQFGAIGIGGSKKGV